jgi:hypothetical protein
MERVEDDKLVIYRGHSLFVMGVHEAEIWRMCDGVHTIDAMADSAVNKYAVSREQAVEEITEFLTKLHKKNLILV